MFFSWPQLANMQLNKRTLESSLIRHSFIHSLTGAFVEYTFLTSFRISEWMVSEVKDDDDDDDDEANVSSFNLFSVSWILTYLIP